MAVLRIVSNLFAADPAAAKAFYGDLLGLDLLMDHGWIATYGTGAPMQPQVSFATEGGSGTPVPALSIEVENVETVHGQVLQAGYEIVHPLTVEPWGVKRFFVRDPMGNIVNILQHDA